MALRTHFNQSEVGCPCIAEFTVQRTEALFDHITGLSTNIGCVWFALPDSGCLRWALRIIPSNNWMLFQMLPVFLTVIAFVGIDGRTFG